ncbi:uncharacterized protein LOC125383551 [Haliotis rufescens]|uniref:uncharacterized protein LOC125383551 n=1 Tax=Haliotis rufescens TaxID=6454 RepID=UPI00201F368E|nr:uncharacterized protein LOC125383551 [Haliotis rufescens]
METVSIAIVIGLVSMCGVSDVHADTNLTAFTGQPRLLEGEINAWNKTAVYLETKMNNTFSTLDSSLKERLTNTFIPSLMKALVKQAITGILKEGYIEDIIRGRDLDEVNSLKANVHNTKTQLQAVKQQFRHVEREGDTFKESVVKLCGELTEDIHGLQLQLNETVAGLCDAKIVNTAIRQAVNTSCVKMNQATEKLTNDNKSSRVGLRGMQQKFSADIQSLNNQLNQTINDLHDSKQRITGLTEDIMALNTSCVMREGIKENDVNETLLSTSPPMFPGASGATPSPADFENLHDASGDVDLEEMKRVLSSPADCRRLFDASKWGELEMVERLLSRGVDANCWLRKRSRTPVMTAALRGHRDVVELLVSKGADVSLVDKNGENTFHLACREDKSETVKFLLSLNVVDIDASNKQGRTAGYLATSITTQCLCGRWR